VRHAGQNEARNAGHVGKIGPRQARGDPQFVRVQGEAD
jgi:hypothetical protein